ncbi:fibrous sheath CABYR-binding protein-like [Anguilla rostrata]|uniref:fibrous sheath CABYR-binding protein-like n=1 Tax=Anguilla anguilla TaxID=7936 RepID=UPI0015ABBE31|nr:fibrous sheath CABYR-binding protein-like [Anguilla anguilla]XP_035251132.1 fibrous sheath CABYR-binding protein-like [Anguilla anguilla]XP_035251133.1 fibrous sheath CABYR-binding protein-like [Anguilla anguilla]XP_035251134.1 fibrous sheath CABYR-binding protein-like [Anguilla anguilla]
MEAKSKIGPGAPKKQTERTGKKEAATPRKANAAPVAPPRKNNPSRATPPPQEAPPPEEAPPPAAPAAEQPVEDGALEQNETANHQPPAEGAEATEPKKHCLDCLKPLLIGGAVVAAAAILVGAFMVARRN